jgi:hypothetical protein
VSPRTGRGCRVRAEATGFLNSIGGEEEAEAEMARMPQSGGALGRLLEMNRERTAEATAAVVARRAAGSPEWDRTEAAGFDAQVGRGLDPLDGRLSRTARAQPIESLAEHLTEGRRLILGTGKFGPVALASARLGRGGARNGVAASYDREAPKIRGRSKSATSPGPTNRSERMPGLNRGRDRAFRPPASCARGHGFTGRRKGKRQGGGLGSNRLARGETAELVAGDPAGTIDLDDPHGPQRGRFG